MGNPMREVKGKVWSTTDDFTFPENELDQYKEKEIGIAFSGGGTRSSTMVAGQLRALQETGFLKKAKYISAVSGGAWGAVPFTFLDKSIEDDDYLGKGIEPDKLTIDKLEDENPLALTTSAANASILDDVIKNIFAGDERFSRAMGEIYLNQIGLNNRKKFFSLNSNTVDAICKMNSKMRPADFYTTKDDRPFLIVGGTILRPKLNRYQFEMTPLYVGTYSYHPGAGFRKRYDIGGGYVQPHVFDSDAPESGDIKGNEVDVHLGSSKHMFTLSDILGTTGSAPAEYADRSVVFGKIGFPEFRYWNPRNVISPDDPDLGKPGDKEYNFGDGGILENLGIMPLIKRKVKRIVVFVNSESNPELLDSKSGTYKIASSLKPLFTSVTNKFGAEDFSDNIVFENNNGEYDDLYNALVKKARAKKIAVHTAKYKVREQKHYDIEGGWETTVTWVYNSMPDEWHSQLPLDIKRDWDKEYGERFPFLRTFFENFPMIIQLKQKQANLLAHLTYWITKTLINDGEFESND